MKYNNLLVFVLFIILGCRPQYRKFDNNLPGKVPQLFAENLLSKNNEHVGYCAFSTDGSELFYATTNDSWSMSKLIRISADNLNKKDTLNLKDKNYEGEPFLSWDGKSMYFMAVLPPKEGEIWHADQYRVQKTANGWSTPERLDSVINSKASEWHISMTRKNVMYFTSEREMGTSALCGDIYKIDVVGDKFVNRVKLPYPINTEYNDSDPLIAPDESFLIFHSDRPGGFGQHDLYISFNQKGSWTAPVNMGPTINTDGWEMAPSLTPDGKYLLYTYRREMVTTDPARIFWVSTRILKKYR